MTGGSSRSRGAKWGRRRRRRRGSGHTGRRPPPGEAAGGQRFYQALDRYVPAPVLQKHLGADQFTAGRQKALLGKVGHFQGKGRGRMRQRLRRRGCAAGDEGLETAAGWRAGPVSISRQAVRKMTKSAAARQAANRFLFCMSTSPLKAGPEKGDFPFNTAAAAERFPLRRGYNRRHHDGHAQKASLYAYHSKFHAVVQSYGFLTFD